MDNKLNDKLLIVEHLSMEYHSPRRLFEKEKPGIKAVNDVSFFIKRGETLGVVGESGCGKTTLGKCIVRLNEPSEGKIHFNDDGNMVDILSLKGTESHIMRKKIQIIFQDIYASLNPVHNILEAFDEPMRVHGIGGGDKEVRKKIIAECLEAVNLPQECMYRYPHEFSGGQRQRICIAKALVLQPRLIVCDEPVSALDVSIQAQILNLMRKLQKQYDLAYMFIAHDLSVVQYMSDRIAVMCLGQIVEIGDANELCRERLHPYTQALLSAVPVPVYGANQDRIVMSGDVPSFIKPPSGCIFHPRCSKCMEICKEVKPELKVVRENGHCVACHFAE